MLLSATWRCARTSPLCAIAASNEIATVVLVREPRTVLPSTAIGHSVPGSRVGAVRADRKAPIAASSASPFRRASRRRTVAGCGTTTWPVRGSGAKPRALTAQPGASVIHSPIAARERAPASTAAAAAASSAGSGCRRPLRSRGSGTESRKGRRAAASIRGAEEGAWVRCSSAADMGNDAGAVTGSFGSRGSRQPHHHWRSALHCLPDPRTRCMNRTDPFHAMPLDMAQT